MLPFTTYSILVVTLFRLRTIEFSDRVLLRLGIVLQRDKRCPVEFARAEKLIRQYAWIGNLLFIKGITLL